MVHFCIVALEALSNGVAVIGQLVIFYHRGRKEDTEKNELGKRIIELENI